VHIIALTIHVTDTEMHAVMVYLKVNIIVCQHNEAQTVASSTNI